MNLLIVDDQYDVVHGMLEGIDWDSLQVDQVFPAYNAMEAMQRFETDQVDILLCDIEMPMQNGLELFRWVKQHYENVECIFLSSHSDFEYAQEALKLGSFDYILQPARYEEIESAVRRAMEKIQRRRHELKYHEYVEYWKQNENVLIDNCLRGYLQSQSNDLDKLLEDLSRLNVPLTGKETLRPVLLEMIDCRNRLSEWNSELLKYAIQNILKDLLSSCGTLLLTLQFDLSHYLLLLKEDQGKSVLSLAFHNFGEICQLHLDCSCACYIGSCTALEQLKEQYQQLTALCQDNIAQYPRVFQLEEWKKESKPSLLPDMEHWKFLLLHGSIEAVRGEVYSYLDQITQKGDMTGRFLARFTQDYVQMFLDTAHQLHLKTQDIFSEHYSTEGYIGAFHSLEQLKQLVDFTICYLQQQTQQPEDAPLPSIERAIAYINQNIERDLSRNEIAEAAYLNPEYLSRLFKREKGVSLGDFILNRRMEIAQSLLASTNLPVGIIASKVGYPNPSYFSQVFRKVCGLSPNEYRQQEENRKK